MSIIVPVYNVERYLEECVESVLSQTYSDFELLLIDDGSTDGSGVLCDKLSERDTRIRVIHKQNGGSSSARNYGIDEANGEWVVFLDADDKWSNADGLGRLCEYAATYNLDVLRFEYQSMNDEMTVCLPQVIGRKDDICNKVLSNYKLVKRGIDGEWFTVLFLLRREILRMRRFNVGVNFQEDIDFYCRLLAAQNYRCGYIAERLYLYRKRGNSLSTTPRMENLQCSFRLCDVFWEQSRQIHDKQLADLYVHYSVMMYYWTLQTLASDVYYGDRAHIIDELNLERLHQEVCTRLHQGSVCTKYLPFIIPTPCIGVRLLHVKDKLCMLVR